MTAPALNGIHHLKVHVSDARRSARWYRRVLGYQPSLEFYEDGQLVGFGMNHPAGGTTLTIRLDPELARQTSAGVYFEMGVHGEAGLYDLAEHLDRVREPHGPVVRTPIGWILPGVYDPDRHQMRFYVSDPAREPDDHRPRRIHQAGTAQAHTEPLTVIDLGLDDAT